jgi:orotidine-5'-phosphate decarboxylase
MVMNMRMRKEHGLIIAFDMDDVAFAANLAKDLKGAEGNFAIKIGRPLEMQTGKGIIAKLKEFSDLPLIYDGKIADIPYISRKIAENAYGAGADAVIVQGFVGSDVLNEIVDLGLGDVIAVVEMTHPGSDEYIQPVSEKIAEMVEDIGVDGVVLPATRPERVKKLVKIVKKAYVISPGIKAQGANPGDAILHGADYEVVGRAIYEADNPKKAAEEIYKEVIERCH